MLFVDHYRIGRLQQQEYHLAPAIGSQFTVPSHQNNYRHLFTDNSLSRILIKDIEYWDAKQSLDIRFLVSISVVDKLFASFVQAY